jgi:hypothetical protein
MANLYPMQPLGEAESSRELLTYADRDPIGIEDEAAAPTDYSGWNEGAAWTRRYEENLEAEHDGYGLHNTLRIGRALVVVNYNWRTSEYVLFHAYAQDTSGNEYFGDDAVSGLSDANGDGRLVVTFTFNLPSTNMRINNFTQTGDYSQPVNDDAAAPVLTHNRCYFYASAGANSIEVIRYEEGVATHGAMGFHIHFWS